MIILDDLDDGKSREQVLMDLLYETNGFRMPLDKVTFGKPTEVDPRKDLDKDHNTFIPITVDKSYDDRFVDGSGLVYRRRSIAEQLNSSDLLNVIPLVLPFKLTDILDQINANIPYMFHKEDFIDREYKTLEEVVAGITLTAKKDSWIWYGANVFAVNTKKIQGAPLISNTMLDGFNKYVG